MGVVSEITMRHRLTANSLISGSYNLSAPYSSMGEYFVLVPCVLKYLLIYFVPMPLHGGLKGNGPQREWHC